MGTAIEVRGLAKTYGRFEAVKGIDLDVDEGEILAFLGPNGAGKTTTIEILEGYRSRDDGQVRVLGVDPAAAPLAWREQIGIVLQESEPMPELTALESVEMHAGYYRDPRRPAEVLDIVGLTESADQRTRKLSGGQKRRLDLALALVGNPRLVFLDEPTTGFDPSARRESWGMIEALRQFGTTVLLTTHYMDEAEQLADRIVVIADGEIAARGTAADLADQVGAATTVSWCQPPGTTRPPESLDAQLGVTVEGDSGSGSGSDSDGGGDADCYQFSAGDPVPALHQLTTWALDNSIELADLQVRKPTLEDVYLQLVRGSDVAKASEQDR